MAASTLPLVRRADRVAVLVVCGVAALVAIGWLVAAVVSVAHALLDHALTLTQLSSAAYAPLQGAPGVLSATTSEVTVSLTGVDTGPRLLLAAGAALTALSWAAIAAIVANLAWRIWRGAPFTRLVFRSGLVATFVLILGPFPGATLTAFGSATALEPLKRSGEILFGQTLDLGSWGAAFAVLLVTTAIGIGQRLQRDAEGLV